MQLQSIVHGVILLEQTVTEYSAERRRLTVRKMRGIGFRGGVHDYVIRRGGLDVFPRLIAGEHVDDRLDADVPSGHEALDHLPGGGLPSGSSTLLIDPAGIGKSSVALHLAIAAADRRELRRRRARCQRSPCQVGHDRQPQRLSSLHAAGEIPQHSTARAVHLPQPPRTSAASSPSPSPA
jgi:hypothetical protein